MKDYALKINGHNYDVRIDDVNESSTLAHVVVNGTAYEVEIAGAKGAATKRPQVAPAPREANSAKITPATAAPAPRIAPVAPTSGYTLKCPLAGNGSLDQREGRRHDHRRSDARDPRSDEDGEQHRRRPRRCGQADLRPAGRDGHGGR